MLDKSLPVIWGCIPTNQVEHVVQNVFGVGKVSMSHVEKVNAFNRNRGDTINYRDRWPKAGTQGVMLSFGYDSLRQLLRNSVT